MSIINSVPQQGEKGDIGCGCPRTKDAEDITFINAEAKGENHD